jgi:penicillin-binding protein 1A
MPSIYQLENPKLNLATQIYSNDGKLIDNFFIEKRMDLPYESIPQNFIHALIATEDRNYYNHWGVHVTRIFKAAVKNIFAGRTKEGASTITMQLARNLYLNQDVTMTRKIREAFTAVQIEKNYTKDQILQLYSNTVYFGRGAYGLNVASQVFFDKPPQNLSLSECATLVAILKNPYGYDPFLFPEKSSQRRNLVLSLMLEQDMITPEDYLHAAEEPLLSASSAKASKQTRSKRLVAPHFVEMIRQDLRGDPRLVNFDLYRDGLVINTTLNYNIQKYANDAVEEHLNELQKYFSSKWSWSRNKNLLNELVDKAVRMHPLYQSSKGKDRDAVYNKLKNNQKLIDSVKNIASTIQVGLVVLDVNTGDILAMVGASPKFINENLAAKYSLNHVTQIKRQPGSAFKPFVYASALQKGLSPFSQIECGPFSTVLETGEQWTPDGSGSCAEGETRSLYSALAGSINSVSARLITEITSPEEVVQLAKRMGIKSPLMAYPALALGAGGDVSPMEMASAFGTFPTHGKTAKTRFLKSVEDHYGNVLIKPDRKPTISKGIISDTLAEEMIFMMKAVVDGGTASVIKQYLTGVDAAGKTGTTNDAADAWFVGYTPELVCAIWLGFDDKRVNFDCLGGYGYGGRTAAPIWGRLMAKVYSDLNIPYKKKSFGISINHSELVPEAPIPNNTQR